MYEGGYWNDERCGKGISYDLNGNVDFEGEWVNNHIVDQISLDHNMDCIPISINTTSVNIPFSSSNPQQVIFRPSPLLVQLKALTIFANNYHGVQMFIIDGLENLSSIDIADNSFRQSTKVNASSREMGHTLRIYNCPSLKTLKIGDYSFCDYSNLVISKVPSLQSISFGKGCFYYSDCVLYGRYDDIMHIIYCLKNDVLNL